MITYSVTLVVPEDEYAPSSNDLAQALTDAGYEVEEVETHG